LSALLIVVSAGFSSTRSGIYGHRLVSS